MAQPSRSPPLSKLVEEAYEYSVGYRLVRGLINWRRYRDIISGEGPESARQYLIKHIKQSQFKSGQVLQEWWKSAYHVRSFMQASQTAFFNSALKVISGKQTVHLHSRIPIQLLRCSPMDQENMNGFIAIRKIQRTIITASYLLSGSMSSWCTTKTSTTSFFARSSRFGEQ